jgi:hypothetical protein
VRSAREDGRYARLEQLGEVCAILQGARAVLERGWLQNAWFARSQQPDTAGQAAAPAAKPPTATAVTAACLVGAVVHATCERRPGATPRDAGPTLDVLWDAWQETRGLAGPGVSGRAASPEVRLARVRDLTRWNDNPGRTRTEVIALLDLAASRAIMEGVTGPPVRASGSSS